MCKYSIRPLTFPSGTSLIFFIIIIIIIVLLLRLCYYNTHSLLLMNRTVITTNGNERNKQSQNETKYNIIIELQNKGKVREIKRKEGINF